MSDIADFVKGLPDQFEFRPLQLEDYHRGSAAFAVNIFDAFRYLDVLKDLTVVGEISEDQFSTRFLSMAATDPPAYFVIVAYDKE